MPSTVDAHSAIRREGQRVVDGAKTPSEFPKIFLIGGPAARRAALIPEPKCLRVLNARNSSHGTSAVFPHSQQSGVASISTEISPSVKHKSCTCSSTFCTKIGPGLKAKKEGCDAGKSMKTKEVLI